MVASGAMHLTLLALVAFGFARAPKFADAPESIPVETITTSELNEIMQGEKHAKPGPAKPAPAPSKPEPPTPPEPPKRPEPVKPESPAPEPPARPEPARPEPPKPRAEEAPTPPVKPHVAARPETPPRPPEKPRLVAKLEEPPLPPEKSRVPEKDLAKPPEKFKPDEIAKALAKEKLDEKPRPKPPAFDSTAISKLIGQTKTADASPTALAPQGLANHNAPRMSVSLENALNEWFRDSYKNCWNLPPSNPGGENYVFDVRVTFNPDGSLSGKPTMLNPPRDPQWRAHADSAMRAVQRCNPLHIPAQYAPYFDQWRQKTIHFDPASAEG